MTQRPCRARHRATSVAGRVWLENIGKGTLTSSAGGATTSQFSSLQTRSRASQHLLQHRSRCHAAARFCAHDPHPLERTRHSGSGALQLAERVPGTARNVPGVRVELQSQSCVTGTGSPSEHGSWSHTAPQWMSHFDNRTRRGGTHAKRHARHTLCSTDPPDVCRLSDRRAPTRSDIHHARGREPRQREHLPVQGGCISRRRPWGAGTLEGSGAA
jgi:hypothetical protein